MQEVCGEAEKAQAAAGEALKARYEAELAALRELQSQGAKGDGALAMEEAEKAKAGAAEVAEKAAEECRRAQEVGVGVGEGVTQPTLP